MINKDTLAQLLDGGVVLDESGNKVGKVGQVYLDDDSGNPEWVTASTGFFGTTETFIPIRDADANGEEVRVPYSKDMIKDAPRMEDADGHLSPQQEQELYQYYGLADTTTTQGGGVGGDRDRGHGRDTDHDRDHDGDRDHDRDGVGGAGHDTSGPDTDNAMTRSEEQVHVGTEKVSTGKARLRKYVVTENVTTTVPVQHEEVRLEREPITEENRGEAVTGGELTDEEHEVTLSEERVVVDKETVPVERVRMDTDTVTDQQEVTEEVRKEQIEADLPDDESRRD